MESVEKKRFGCIVGTAFGGMETCEKQARAHGLTVHEFRAVKGALEAKKEEFSTLLDKLIVYEQFLETTLETAEDFQEIGVKGGTGKKLLERLASDDASFMTGAHMVMAGGATI